MNEEKKEYPIYSQNPASYDFVGCFMGGGSPSHECWCGRTHVAIDSDLLEEGQLENYIEWQKQDPEGVIFVHDCECVHYVEINGRTFVDDCPCNGMRPFETLFWENRKNIRKYLSIVKMKLLADAADVGDWEEDL